MSGIHYYTEGIFAIGGIFADHRWHTKVMDANKIVQEETRQKSSLRQFTNDLPSHRIYSLIQWKEMINSDLN